jgi:hypothetical protein
MAMTVLRPSDAAAQRADGVIGVSLTILPPVPERTVTIARIDRDGAATIRITNADPTRMTTLVTARVAGETSGDGDGHLRARSCAQPRIGRDDSIAYRVDVRRSRDDAAPHELFVRMEILVVAGT